MTHLAVEDALPRPGERFGADAPGSLRIGWTDLFNSISPMEVASDHDSLSDLWEWPPATISRDAGMKFGPGRPSHKGKHQIVVYPLLFLIEQPSGLERQRFNYRYPKKRCNHCSSGTRTKSQYQRCLCCEFSPQKKTDDEEKPEREGEGQLEKSNTLLQRKFPRILGSHLGLNQRIANSPTRQTQSGGSSPPAARTLPTDGSGRSCGPLPSTGWCR